MDGLMLDDNMKQRGRMGGEAVRGGEKVWKAWIEHLVLPRHKVHPLNTLTAREPVATSVDW